MSLDLAALPLLGVLDRTLTPYGLVLNRVPAWARAQIGDSYLDLMASMPSGGRLAFRTDATYLELDLQVTALQYESAPVFAPCIDLVVDDELVTTSCVEPHRTLVVSVTSAPKVLPGGPATVRLDLPGSRERSVEVWLPHNATVELQAARSDAPLLPLEARRRWSHYGSSISQCLGAPSPTRTWPAVAARRAGLELLNLGLGGQCHLDQQIARVLRDQPADVLSLKLGINVVADDSMRERVFRPALHAFLDIVREGHPTTPLLLTTPLHSPPVEDHPGPLAVDGSRFDVVQRPVGLSKGALSLGRVRELVAQVAEVRQDPHLVVVDGLQLLGPDDTGHLPDALHPDPGGDELVADRFLEHLERALDRAPVGAAQA